jgi:hypothetical protein
VNTATDLGEFLKQLSVYQCLKDDPVAGIKVRNFVCDLLNIYLVISQSGRELVSYKVNYFQAATVTGSLLRKLQRN